MLNRSKKTMPLANAILSGNIEEVRRHLEAGVDPNQPIPEKDGYPLHFAAHSYAKLIQLLIEHGADVNVRDGDGKTPLHIAAIIPYVEGMQVLIEHGADVNAVDNAGRTPLSNALQGTPAASFLAGLGAAPDERVMAQRKQAVELLIAHGAR
jgi:ankyrin repeat protein